MRKSIIVLLVLIFLFISSSYLLAAELPLEIVIDGWPIYSDEPPVISSNRVLVPIRVLTENLGYDVLWKEKEQKVYISKDNLSIGFEIGIAKMWINGNEKAIDVKPVIINGRTYLPVRVVSEAIGAEVIWDSKHQDVLVNTGKEAIEISSSKEDPSKIIYDEYFSFKLIKNYISGYEVYQLDNPSRIVIDFDKTALEEIILPELKDSKIVKQVRYSQYEWNPNKVRVVIDLNYPVDYYATIIDNSFIIGLKPHIYKVVLDAGHGGEDSGAIGVAGTYEKNLNLIVTLKLVELLKDNPNIQIFLTRDSDVYISLIDRIDYSNSLDADIYLSIHHNSIPYNSSTNGTETYYGRDYSLELANIVHKHLLASTGFLNRGIDIIDFRVIRYTRIPAVLIEVGYLSNRAEEKKMVDSEFQDNVARGLESAIKEYFNIE